MVQLQRKTGTRGKTRGGKGEGPGKEEQEAHRLWGTSHADDAVIASRSIREQENLMTLVVTAMVAFGATTSKAKGDIMCL